MDGGAIAWFGPGEGTVLRFGWWRMLESLECSGDVAGHTDVNMVVEVIPVNGEANVEVACPVNGDLVFELEDGDEMLSVFASFVFDAEVIDDQTECNWAGRVCE